MAEMLIAWGGFLLATYAVISNDAAQTLGTLIASHPRRKIWLWAGASTVLVGALVFSWHNYDGDISFGRLTRIPEVELDWYYLMAPIGLLILTRMGAPVSTSFIMLAMFTITAEDNILESILTKSGVGYFLAFFVAVMVWGGVGRRLNFKKPANLRFWRPVQYITTGSLWWFWLSHDVANVAVFLPRQLSELELVIVCAAMVGALALLFREAGGRVHKFVFRGEYNEMDIRVACMVDAIYAVLLFVFKEYNNVPMSTTWVFVGLMGGREIGRALWMGTRREGVIAAASRFMVLVGGAAVSLGLVMVVTLLK